MPFRPAAWLACLFALPVFGQSWREGFEQGIGSARPYHADPPTTPLELVADGAAEGNRYLRATLPGQRRLEGFAVTATGLPGARLAVVSVKVRGRGELWLCLYSRNGWLYAPATTALTAEWQTISLAKVLVAADTTLGINFLTREVQPGAVFEVDDIAVRMAPALTVADTPVGPWRLEAEDFLHRAADRADDPSASGAACGRTDRYLRLTGLPFPRTSRPVTIALRVRAGSEKEEWRLGTTQGGLLQRLAAVRPPAGDWQWLRFPPVSAGEVGDSFEIEAQRDPGEVGATAIDAIVLGTDLPDGDLLSAPALFADRPLLAVARCTQAPTIDGRDDDPCWRTTATAGGFLAPRSLAPAAVDTTVRACYDDRQLYFLFVCPEPILEVTAQRRHEFAARVHQPDGNVAGDDACLVLLDPEGSGRQIYDFIVNALGTVADARCAPPDLWENRDLGWNSGAHAAGRIDDGVWSVELAIPFAALGGAPQPGARWRAVLGRIATSRGETSSWNPSNRGFHDPYTMGTLAFEAGPLGLTVVGPRTLQPRGNAVRVAADPPLAGGVYLWVGLLGGQGARHYRQVSFETSPQPLTFDAPEETELQFGCGALEASTLRPLWLSPVLPRVVKAAFADLTIACDGPYELRVNDEVIAQGAAERATVHVALQKGPNTLALRVANGAAALRLTAPGLASEAVRWKQAPATTPDAALTATDDSGWPTAAVVGQVEGVGPVVGTAGEPSILRHTLCWEKTRVWPTPAPALYIARGTPQQVTFIADGLPGRRLHDWAVTFAVPPEFEILGSAGYYAGRGEMPTFECTVLGEQTVAGRPMRVARVVASKPVVPGRHPIMSLFHAFVRCAPEAAVEGDSTAFIYWTEANDGTVTEPPQTVPVRLLPPVSGRQPKRLVWQLWGSFFDAMDKPDMRRLVLATARDAGFNNIVAGNAWSSDAAAEFGLTNTMGFNFQAWSLNLRPYLAEHPEQRLVRGDGQPDDGLLCMTELLGPAWPAVEELLAAKLAESHPRAADYDYEYSPFTGPHSCFCERCLAAFRRTAGLPADAPLNAELIRERHAEAWVDFMARRVAEMFARFREAIHRRAPGCLLSVYSGYQTPENPLQYGVDWRYVGELQAADRVGCGYGRPVTAIRATVDALRGIPALFGELIVPYDTAKTEPLVPLTPATLLRRALDATGGVLIYERNSMDGRCWRAVGEITRLVAEFEDLFLTAPRAPVGDLDEAVATALSDGRTTLVCLLNESSATVTRQVTLPPEAGPGREFYSDRAVQAGATIQETLVPGAVAVYVLRR